MARLGLKGLIAVPKLFTAVFVRCHRWGNFWRYFRIVQMLRECRRMVHTDLLCYKLQ